MKQAQFISLMAETFGVEEVTVKQVIRALREADMGLITTGARGVNAPDNTPLDAVRVLLALMVSTMPSRAVRDVEYFGQLQADIRDVDVWGSREGIDPDKTLEQMLVELAEQDWSGRWMEATLEVSQSGRAVIYTPTGPQEYHQRDRMQAVLEAVSLKNEAPSENAEARVAEAIGRWDSAERSRAATIDRWSRVALDRLREVVFLVNGGSEDD